MKPMTDERFYRDALKQLAEAAGIVDPIQLIALAENNEENYVDLLAKHIRRLHEENERLKKAVAEKVDAHDLAERCYDSLALKHERARELLEIMRNFYPGHEAVEAFLDGEEK